MKKGIAIISLCLSPLLITNLSLAAKTIPVCPQASSLHSVTLNENRVRFGHRSQTWHIRTNTFQSNNEEWIGAVRNVVAEKTDVGKQTAITNAKAGISTINGTPTAIRRRGHYFCVYGITVKDSPKASFIATLNNFHTRKK